MAVQPTANFPAPRRGVESPKMSLRRRDAAIRRMDFRNAGAAAEAGHRYALPSASDGAGGAGGGGDDDGDGVLGQLTASQTVRSWCRFITDFNTK